MKDDTQKNFTSLWIRHGLSKGNVAAAEYKGGDENVELTDEGWRQGIRLGQFLAKYLPEQGVTKWPRFIVGEFKRHQQTTAAILHGMGAAFDGKPNVTSDHHLNEQSWGGLPFMHDSENESVKLSVQYSKATAKANKFQAKPIYGESPREVLGHVEEFTQNVLKPMRDAGEDMVICVTSGRVKEMAVMHICDLPSTMLYNPNLEKPGNCDVIRLDGLENCQQAIKIFDGASGKPAYKNVIEGIERLSIDSLPTVPERIVSEPEFTTPDMDNEQNLTP